jgi:hypothetical protein
MRRSILLARLRLGLGLRFLQELRRLFFRNRLQPIVIVVRLRACPSCTIPLRRSCLDPFHQRFCLSQSISYGNMWRRGLLGRHSNRRRSPSGRQSTARRRSFLPQRLSLRSCTIRICLSAAFCWGKPNPFGAPRNRPVFVLFCELVWDLAEALLPVVRRLVLIVHVHIGESEVSFRGPKLFYLLDESFQMVAREGVIVELEQFRLWRFGRQTIGIGVGRATKVSVGLGQGGLIGRTRWSVDEGRWARALARVQSRIGRGICYIDMFLRIRPRSGEVRKIFPRRPSMGSRKGESRQ